MEPKKTEEHKHTYGKFVFKATKSQVVVCASCSGKYIKTRPRQSTCLTCASRKTTEA